jgi:hypothetical protein
MRPRNRHRRMLTLLAISGVAAMSVATSTATAAVRPASPLNGVYTCDWIASHATPPSAPENPRPPAVFAEMLAMFSRLRREEFGLDDARYATTSSARPGVPAATTTSLHIPA